jgi:dTDP-4-dehydro-6-deoxy-alpha-D-glucopyranose 2,3-dehydratase
MQDAIARTADALEQTLRACRAGFKVRRVPASAADQWGVTDGALQHRSRGFFSVTGVRRGRENCLLLYQPQGAVTGLLTARIDGEPCFLLQGRAEPGCLEEAQFGPTVQSTPANFMRLHGGAATPYIETFIAYMPDAALIDDTTQLDLGARYLAKSKRSLLVETFCPAAPQPGFVWATRSAICEAAGRSAFLNIDLRSILSIAAWSRDESGAGPVPRSDDIRRNLDAPVRPEALADLMRNLHAAEPLPARFVPIESLENWRRTEWGWAERERRQGFDVEFFEVEAALREKAAWTQPLVNSAAEGCVTLACRERQGFLEFLVRPAAEIGLATHAAIAPSHVVYPGATAPALDWLHGRPTWSSTVESDEGGRFYRDASRYQIVHVDDAGDIPAQGGAWVRLPELKLLLRMSNLCTIQLRGVVSQLLGVG